MCLSPKFATFLLVLVVASTCWLVTPPSAQGTLQAVPLVADSRIPIPSLPYTIAQPGSYYLRKNLTFNPASAGNNQNGITIQAEDVTIDLNGYTLRGVGGSLNGIYVSSSLGDIEIKNGVVRGWGATGVNLSNAYYSHVDGIRSRSNGAAGISAGDQCSALNCTTTANGGDGITFGQAASIRACASESNSGRGVVSNRNSLIVDCTARGNSGDGIELDSEGLLRSCVSTHNQGRGIDIGDTCVVEDALSSSNGSHGIQTNDRAMVRRCVTGNNSGDGIRLQHNCYASENIVTNNTSWGIEATATECRIESNHLLENVAGAVKLLGCGAFVARNTAGNGVGSCPATDLSLLFDVGSDNNVGAFVNNPGVGFTADTWANFGL